jgi:hypothetical protein
MIVRPRCVFIDGARDLLVFFGCCVVEPPIVDVTDNVDASIILLAVEDCLIALTECNLEAFGRVLWQSSYAEFGSCLEKEQN